MTKLLRRYGSTPCTDNDRQLRFPLCLINAALVACNPEEKIFVDYAKAYEFPIQILTMIQAAHLGTLEFYTHPHMLSRPRSRQLAGAGKLFGAGG